MFLYKRFLLLRTYLFLRNLIKKEKCPEYITINTKNVIERTMEYMIEVVYG